MSTSMTHPKVEPSGLTPEAMDLDGLLRRLHLPTIRRLYPEFDFKLQTSLHLSLLGTCLGPELVTEGRCLILGGRSGRGKTHLAVSIAYRAIQNGYEAYFTTTRWGT